MRSPLLLPLMALLCACSAPAELPSSTDAAAPAAAEQVFSVEQLRQDFDLLYAGLESAHFDLFARRSEADYDALHTQMRAAMRHPLTATEARMQFQRFVAYGRVAHARIDLPTEAWARFREAGGRAFPLSLRVAGQGVHVLDNYSGLAALAAGTRVLSIDGEPALAWLRRIGGIVSADNDYLLQAQLEHRLPLIVWQQLGEPRHFELEIVDDAGERASLQLPALTRAEAIANEQALPPRFELDFNARQAELLPGAIAYLRPGPFYDNREGVDSPWDTRDFEAFIDQAFAEFARQDAKHLLIDLRDNPGGDNSFSDLLLAYIASTPFRFTEAFEIRASAQTRAAFAARLASENTAASITARMQQAIESAADGSSVRFELDRVPPRQSGRFEGEVYLLINRHSYSNTVMVAAVVQDYGFGTVIGEETADLASTFGAMESFRLAHTGFEVGYPKARILRPNGDPRPRGVIPDVPIETPVQATQDDRVLDQALQWIRSPKVASSP